jgi:transcriptional antiterminator RfaH
MLSEPPEEGPGCNVASPKWFCLRSHSKHEHIAARHLSQLAGVEAFLPRIRFRRTRRQGPVWVTEALFPHYLFARFRWSTHIRLVRHAPGVSDVVHFGHRWPTVPDEVMNELQSRFGHDSVYVLGDSLSPGDEVQISGGAFHGLAGVIIRVIPARERVAVLLEFLGRQAAVEIPADSVVRQAEARSEFL